MDFRYRKPTRLKEFDYSNNGVYFVTVCSKDRKPIFSRIVGDGDLDVPKVLLSNYGNKIKNNLEYMNKIYNHIEINNYVIMPNHIHILINVSASGMSGSPSPTNEVIPSFIGTLKRFVNKEVGENIFQRSYNDHIIRNERDYLEHYTYIENNPIRWELDELYTISI